MSFQCQLYVDLARELISCCKADHIDDEAYFRTSVSRSYYGVFLVARQVMELKGIPISRRGGVHQQVQFYFSSSGNQIEKKIGKALKDLRIERNKADYNLATKFDKDRADKAYERAMRTIRYLSNI